MGKFFLGMLLLLTLVFADSVGSIDQKCPGQKFAVNCAKCSRVKCQVCNDHRPPVNGFCKNEPCLVSECLNCPTSSSICFDCRPGWRLEQNVCIKNPCIANCKACDKDSTCINCYEGYHASNDKKLCQL